MLEYGSISRFKAVFRGFYVFRVGLCCFGALRGLWGFCTRVELGGYMTCCVFAFRFLLFSSCPLFFSFRPAFVACFPAWLLLLVWVLVSLFVVVVGFLSLSDELETKRKGAKVFPLRPFLRSWLVVILLPQCVLRCSNNPSQQLDKAVCNYENIYRYRKSL